MKHRDLIRTGALLIAGFLFHGLVHAMQINQESDEGRKTPNLLFIHTDELRADMLSAYGHYSVIMPNINVAPTLIDALGFDVLDVWK